MVTTNTSDKGNFYVHTSDPAGSWSDPLWVEQGGIDPDIFFDDDGKIYFVSANSGIYLSELDIKTGKLLTQPRLIWNGTGGRHAEAPHIYKKDGFYYLLLAEGGTEYGHKATIGRSKNIYGPYDSNPANPILTHINQTGAYSPIQGTGHADFIQAHDGSWWVVFLGFRPQSYTHHVLGRETFLAPMVWSENAWPVVNGDGTVAVNMTCNTLPQVKVGEKPLKDDFTGDKPGNEWNYINNPVQQNYSLSERKGFLRLKASDVKLKDSASPTFLCRRQQHFDFSATTLLDFAHLLNGSEAGISVYMSTNYHYDLFVKNDNGKNLLTLTYALGMLDHQEIQIPVAGTSVYLKVTGESDYYSFYYSENNIDYELLGMVDTRFISSETAGGFTGAYIGLFAQSDNTNASYADFDWFEYAPLIK